MEMWWSGIWRCGDLGYVDVVVWDMEMWWSGIWRCGGLGYGDVVVWDMETK